MDDIDWILIKELYKTKNLTQTAEALFVSQPTITKKIKKIEQELNITVYKRKSRGITFTEQGKYLAQKAEEIVDEIEGVKQSVKSMSSQAVGKLNIGVSNHFAKYNLPAILREFKEEHPFVEFNIHSGYGKEIFELMNTQNIHISFIRAKYDWNGIKEKLDEDPMCLVSKDRIDMDELPFLPRIEYQTGSITTAMIEEWWETHFERPPTIGMRVDNVEGCKEMVGNGLGYGILPESIIKEGDKLHKAYLISPDDEPLVVDSWMYYTESLLENKVISEFVSFVKNKYEGVQQ